jgi:hypothetical protein
MRVRVQTLVVERNSDWVEFTSVKFPSEDLVQPDGVEVVIGTDDIDFTPPLGPVLLTRRALAEGFDLELVNRWETASVPPRGLEGTSLAEEPMPVGRFWQYFNHRGRYPETSS